MQNSKLEGKSMFEATIHEKLQKNLSEKKDKLLLSQTVHFVNFKRFPQLAKTRFVGESGKLLFSFDLLCCFGFHRQIAETLCCSKSLRNSNFVGIRNKMVGIRNQLVQSMNNWK